MDHLGVSVDPQSGFTAEMARCRPARKPAGAANAGGEGFLAGLNDVLMLSGLLSGTEALFSS
jgi:hypothetical protein